MQPAVTNAGHDPTLEALAGAAAKALAAAAERGDSASLATLLAGLLSPLALAPLLSQAALDAALLAAAGGGRYCDIPHLLHKWDAAAAILLGAGAAVDAADRNGATPLHLAAAAGNVRLIRRLLAAGARVDASAYPTGPYDGAMPHHLAASHGRCEALALLLDSGCQVRPLPGDAGC
jgi:uncharacterized protein